jgi:trehalose-phosphatase
MINWLTNADKITVHKDSLKRLSSSLPSALDCLGQIISPAHQTTAVFLDYDGTLTPIVSRPEDAVLPDAVRSTLQRLSRYCILAVVSGRDLEDVRDRVAIPGIWYAGSHGFDISGPALQNSRHQRGKEYLPVLDAAESLLRGDLHGITSCVVERKRFSIAVHYRQVANREMATLKHIIEKIHRSCPQLRVTSGKSIFELQPDIDWGKGEALLWILQSATMTADAVFPIYIGDDITDENAFRVLRSRGIGILVGSSRQKTLAHYRLANHHEVEQFLGRLLTLLSHASS